MATVAEYDLTALLDVQVLVLLDRVSKHVHHANLVVEADHDLEASRVESDTDRIILESLVYLKFKSH